MSEILFRLARWWHHLWCMDHLACHRREFDALFEEGEALRRTIHCFDCEFCHQRYHQGRNGEWYEVDGICVCIPVPLEGHLTDEQRNVLYINKARGARYARNCDTYEGPSPGRGSDYRMPKGEVRNEDHES